MEDTQLSKQPQLQSNEPQRSKKRKTSDSAVEEEDKTPVLVAGKPTNGKKPPIASPATTTTTTATTSKKAASKGHSTTGAASTSASQSHHDDKDDSGVHDDYEPLSLRDIRTRLSELCERVPPVPPQGLDPKNPSEMKHWAGQLQAVLEEFNLLVCCISTATYKWGTDRSGAADQHLALLSGELAASQDQISSTVTPRLTNVLAPVVDLVVDRIITTKTNTPANSSSLLAPAVQLQQQQQQQDDNHPLSQKVRNLDDNKVKGYDDSSTSLNDHDQFMSASSNDAVLVEVKQNIFDRKFVDEDFLVLCHTILSRNAPLLRQVVLANFHKLRQCLADYLEATQKDSYVESSRGFAY